jgi:hypothetical protein
MAAVKAVPAIPPTIITSLHMEIHSFNWRIAESSLYDFRPDHPHLK